MAAKHDRDHVSQEKLARQMQRVQRRNNRAALKVGLAAKHNAPLEVAARAVNRSFAKLVQAKLSLGGG